MCSLDDPVGHLFSQTPVVTTHDSYDSHASFKCYKCSLRRILSKVQPLKNEGLSHPFESRPVTMIVERGI